MASTDESVRDVLVNAIKAIAVTKLDFDANSGNVKDYLLDYELEEHKSAYLMARSKNKQKIRAWGVNVRSKDEWFAANDIMRRTYFITLKAYYGIEAEGQAFKDLIEHLRKVREAIKNLHSTLSGTVDLIAQVDFGNISLVTNTDAGLPAMYEATLEYVAEKRNPDW